MTGRGDLALKERLRQTAEERVRLLAATRRLRFELVIGAIERFADGRPLHVLDAGCAEGLAAGALAKRHPDWTVVGVDLDERTLADARSWAERLELTNVEYRQASVLEPLGQDEYDAAAAVECLTEIEDDEGALGRIAAALRPGGLFVTHVPAHDWRPVLGSSPREWPSAVRHGYRADELREKLERAGLVDVQVTPTTRALVHAATEVTDRVKTAGLKVRTLAYPLGATAVRLERAGLRPGGARGLFAHGRKPVPATT